MRTRDVGCARRGDSVALRSRRTPPKTLVSPHDEETVHDHVRPRRERVPIAARAVMSITSDAGSGTEFGAAVATQPPCHIETPPAKMCQSPLARFVSWNRSSSFAVDASGPARTCSWLGGGSVVSLGSPLNVNATPSNAVWKSQSVASAPTIVTRPVNGPPQFVKTHVSRESPRARARHRGRALPQ